jgi:hypothetical protein
MLFLQFTIYIPTLFIWLCAAYGAFNLSQYARVVKTTKDGAGMYPLSVGVNLMVAYLLLSSPLNLVRTYMQGSVTAIPPLTIATNLLAVVFYLAAFIFLYQGSKKLLSQFHGARSNRIIVFLGLVLVAIFMIYYVQSIFTNPTRTVSAGQDRPASYFLTDPLIVASVVIPYLAIWVLSVLTIANLHTVSQKMMGVVYKKGLMRILLGLGGIVVGTILTQGFASLGSERLIDLGLQSILILIYILLLAIALGYWMIARGSAQLRTIESV